MVTNNEAVDNFLNGKRNLAAYQFSQLIKERSIISTQQAKDQQQLRSSSSSSTSTPYPSTSSPPIPLGQSNTPPSTSGVSNDTNDDHLIDRLTLNKNESAAGPASSSQRGTTTGNKSEVAASCSQQADDNCDEIAFNYAMVNLFTGCPERASIIFSDLVKRYPRNPRLWLRLAESMLATERSKMSEFEHIQQLAHPNSRDHLIKTKNRPILIKINPNYCQQQQSQHASVKAPPGTATNFLINIKGYLQKSLDLINEYNDISLLTDDIPTGTNQTSTQQTQSTPSLQDLFGGGVASLPSTSAAATAVGAQSTSKSGINNYLVDNSASSLQDSQQALGNNTTPSSERPVQLSQQLSYANPYKSISRSALYHLRNKVQLNLAYVCLCMGEPIKALNYTTHCLKTSPQGYEKVLASLYHAEACILASRVDEAIQFLNLEILNMARNLSQDHPPLIGDAGRVVHSDDMQHQFDRDALATVVTYNLSVAYAAKGEFSNAQRILMRCLQPTKPIPMQLIICLLYIQLQLGEVEAAKKTILSNLPQFR